MVRPDHIRSGLFSSSQVKSGQVRSGQVGTDTEYFLEYSMEVLGTQDTVINTQLKYFGKILDVTGRSVHMSIIQQVSPWKTDASCRRVNWSKREKIIPNIRQQ